MSTGPPTANPVDTPRRLPYRAGPARRTDVKRLEGIEISRGIAALLIVLLHTTTILETPKYGGTAPFGRLLAAGGFGVDFFFVLSGFIIFFVHRRDIGHPERLRSYLWKRAIRIFPPYWAVLLLVCPLFYLQPSFGDGTEREPLRMLTSWLLLPHPEPPVLPVAWSLRHEVLFYAVFSILIVRPRWGVGALVLWMAGTLGLAATGRSPSFPAAFLFDLRNFDFALGLVAALLVKRGNLPAPGWIAAGGSVALAAVALTESRAPALIGHSADLLLYGVLSALVVAGLGISDLRGTLRYPAWLRLLGAASYSVYLVHLPTLSALAKAGAVLGLPGRLSPEALFLLYAPLATGVGIALHLLVEKPITARLRNRFLPPAEGASGRRTAPPPGTPPGPGDGVGR